MMIYLFPYLEMMMDKTFIILTNKSTSLTLDTFPYGLETSRPGRIKGIKLYLNAMQNSTVTNTTLYIKLAMLHLVINTTKFGYLNFLNLILISQT